jgi:hypothetical protein
MATTYKILGQAAPGTTGATLYTVPSTGQTVISSLIITNTATSTGTFRVLIKSGSGVVTGTNNYLAYDTNVPPNDSIVMMLGLCLSGSAVLQVSGSASTIAFNAFGSETV